MSGSFPVLTKYLARSSVKSYHPFTEQINTVLCGVVVLVTQGYKFFSFLSRCHSFNSVCFYLLVRLAVLINGCAGYGAVRARYRGALWLRRLFVNQNRLLGSAVRQTLNFPLFLPLSKVN